MHRLCKQEWAKRACYVRGCDVFITLSRHHSDFMRKPWRCSCFSRNFDILRHWLIFIDRYLLTFTLQRGGIMVTIGLTGNKCLADISICRRLKTSDEYTGWHCEHDGCLQALRLFALLMPELTLLRRWRRASEVVFFTWRLRWDLSDICVDLIDWCAVQTTFFPYQSRLSFPAKASWHSMGEPLDPDPLLEWVHAFPTSLPDSLTCQLFVNSLSKWPFVHSPNCRFYVDQITLTPSSG